MKKIVLENVLEAMIERTLQEKHMGFDKLKRSLAHKKGVSNPGAVAAAIGRKKYGDKAMQHAAETGHELHEETPMDEEYIGFEKLVDKLKSQGHSEDSAKAIAASIGRKKYGKEKFQHAAATGHKMRGEKPKSESYSGQTGSIQEDPLMADIGKEAESNFLVRDILTTMSEDEKLRQEIMDELSKSQTPEGKDKYNTALGIITKTIREKEGLMQLLSKSKSGMPEAKDPLKDMVDEAVKQVMTEKAPPGLEDMVLALKKKYGEDSPRPFQIAWANYNKKHKK